MAATLEGLTLNDDLEQHIDQQLADIMQQSNASNAGGSRKHEIKGKAWNWFDPILREREVRNRSEWSERAIRILGSYNEMKKAMNQVFGDVDERKTAARKLQRLRQKRSDNNF